MDNLSLALMTGIDIPIKECRIILHQPTIKEIAFIGENDFYTAISILNINKQMYEGVAEDPEITNFHLFITLLQDKNSIDKKEAVLKVLGILLPQYKIIFSPRSLLLNLNGENFIIDESNFEFFQKTLSQVFCLQKSGQDSFNPANSKAKEIADKLMRGRKRVAAQQESSNSGKSQFVQYLSVLTIGLNSMSLNDVMNLTMFQMYDLVERYMLFVNWDLDIKTRLAGGSPDKPVDNWMKPIH